MLSVNFLTLHRQLRESIHPAANTTWKIFGMAGGIARVMQNMSSILDMNVLTVTGKTLQENLDSYQYKFSANIQDGDEIEIDIAKRIVDLHVPQEEIDRRMEEGLQRINELMPFYSLESNPQKIIKEVLNREGIKVNTYCHVPYTYLKDGSLEKAMEIIGTDGQWYVEELVADIVKKALA